jgi:hypothetical protein
MEHPRSNRFAAAAAGENEQMREREKAHELEDESRKHSLPSVFFSPLNLLSLFFPSLVSHFL